VCGHIHKAEIREIDGLLYCNDGDWVESLSALVETTTGELKIIYWTHIKGDPVEALTNQEITHQPAALALTQEATV
jgi:hypothetical protein